MQLVCDAEYSSRISPDAAATAVALSVLLLLFWCTLYILYMYSSSTDFLGSMYMYVIIGVLQPKRTRHVVD